MRKLIVTAAAVAALLVPFSGAVSSAEAGTNQALAGKVFGPYPTSTVCKANAVAAVDDGWRITQPCHKGPQHWYFKAVR